MTNTAPKIYNYNGVTGEYVGDAIADADPLDTGNWLIPGNACLDAPPPEKKGFATIRTESGWAHAEDHRGQVYSTGSGEIAQLQRLGPIPEGFTDKAPPGPFHTWTGKAWRLDKDAELAGATSHALNTRRQKQADASMKIGPLQDALDLQDATESEKDLLTAWKKYRVALNRIELQEGFPKSIIWPKSPDEES